MVCVYLRFFRARQHLMSLALVMNDYDGQMIFGDFGVPKLPEGLTGEEKTPKKLVPIGDGTRARCVRGAHATACPQRWTRCKVKNNFIID